MSRRTQPYDGNPKAAFARSGVKKRVSPVFPREAIRGGHTEAFAYAAIHVDATGEVTETRAKSFPEKTGARLFELETRSATLKWEFNPAANARIYCALVHFALK